MKKRLLIVDDEPMIRSMAERLFQKEGFDTIAVDSGVKCLDHLRNGFEGVVLLDLTMPGLSGWETLEALSMEGLLGRVKVCIFSTKDQELDMKDALSKHVAAYLIKPVEPRKLVETVKRLV